MELKITGYNKNILFLQWPPELRKRENKHKMKLNLFVAFKIYALIFIDNVCQDF